MPHKKTEKDWKLQEKNMIISRVYFTEKETGISKENSVGRNVLS